MNQRTLTQNGAMYLYFEQLANALNEAGYDMKKVLEVKTVDVPWNQDLIKEVLWKTIQEPMTGKTSTTKLETDEVGKVYEVLNRHISQNFGVSVAFPSYDEQLNESRIK